MSEILKLGLVQSSDKNFVFFTINDVINKMLPRKIDNMVEQLGLDQDQTIAVMRHFHWNEERVNEKWFDSQHKLSLEIGITPNQKQIENMSKLKI